MYRERIKRQEGAQLFRIRWYGEAKPSGKEKVFLELKTHHEKWINTKSVKERVNVQEQDVSIFLDLTTGIWTPDMTHPRELVARGAGRKGLSQEVTDTQVQLICTMHNLVLSKKLMPCVRSQYRRVALQASTSNSLRVTIDYDVRLIDETSGTSSSSWCLSDSEASESSRTKVAPFPILEVKLAGIDCPSRIQELVDDTGCIMDAYKFSKFLTGAAAYCRNTIEVLPYWAEHPRFLQVFDSDASQNKNTVQELTERTAETECSSEDSEKASKDSLESVTFSGIPSRRKKLTSVASKPPSNRALSDEQKGRTSTRQRQFWRRSSTIDSSLSVDGSMWSMVSRRSKSEKKLAPKKSVRV